MFNKSKILSLILCICLIFEQAGFAQVSATLDISTHMANLRANFTPAVFRPLHLRHLSYNPQDEALELIRNANIIRLSNLVQYLLYFNIAERIKLLEVMKKEMKEGALLILTRTFKPGYEEGIMYVKKGAELILESFVLTVRMDEDGDLMAGADVIVSRYDKQGLFGRLIIDPLREELKDYNPGKESELNSVLPGLLVGKLKEEYRDDVKQLGEMVSINFEKLRGLIQIIDKESQKEFLEEMAGLIPGAAGEAASSPLAEGKKNLILALLAALIFALCLLLPKRCQI